MRVGEMIKRFGPDAERPSASRAPERARVTGGGGGRAGLGSTRARLAAAAVVVAVTAAVLAVPAAASGSAPQMPDHRTFSGEATAQGSVSLDWGDVSGADAYDVRFWDRDLYEYTVLSPGANSNGITVTFDGSAAAVSGLPDGYGQYWFGVRATNAHGTSGWPAIGIVIAPYQAPPEPAEEPSQEQNQGGSQQPQDPPVQTDPPSRPAKPTVAAITASSVTIEWDDPGDDSITGYQILRRDRAIHGNGVFVVILDDTGTAHTAHTDLTVAASSRYVYRVKAINTAGLSPRSSYANADTPAAPVLIAPVLKSGQQNLDPNPKNFDPIDPEVILDQEPSLGTFLGHPIEDDIEPDSGWHRFTLGDNLWTQADLDSGELSTPDRVGTMRGRGDEDWFRVALQDNRNYTIQIRPDLTGLTEGTIEYRRYPRLRIAYSPARTQIIAGGDFDCFDLDSRSVSGLQCTGGRTFTYVSTWPNSRGGGNYHFSVDAANNMQEPQQDYEIRVTRD